MAVTEEKDSQNAEEQPKKDAVKTNDGSEQEMVPLSQVEALIEAKMKERQAGPTLDNPDLAAAILQLAQSNRAQNEESYDPGKYLTEIDKDDYLDEPVVFWASGFMLVIGDDRQNGIPIKAPYGKIEFEAVGSKRQQRGKDIDIQIWCKYVCESKKVQKFLEDHTLFGVRFFKKAGDTINVDTRYTLKLASYYTGMKNIPAHQVFQQLRDMNLTFTDDVNEARLMIAKVRTDEEMKKYEDANIVRARNESKEGMLIQQLNS